MAATRITALPAASTVDPANDAFVMVDVSDTTPLTPTGTTKKVTAQLIANAIGVTGSFLYSGTYPDPNGNITANPGSIYFDLTTPASPVQWIKTAGTGNTGWI